jgi:hypothetical protein
LVIVVSAGKHPAAFVFIIYHSNSSGRIVFNIFIVVDIFLILFLDASRACSGCSTSISVVKITIAATFYLMIIVILFVMILVHLIIFGIFIYLLVFIVFSVIDRLGTSTS